MLSYWNSQESKARSVSHPLLGKIKETYFFFCLLLIIISGRLSTRPAFKGGTLTVREKWALNYNRPHCTVILSMGQNTSDDKVWIRDQNKFGEVQECNQTPDIPDQDIDRRNRQLKPNTYEDDLYPMIYLLKNRP